MPSSTSTFSDIGRLFIAGILPGIVLTIAMMATISVIARKQDLPRQDRADFKTVVKAFREAAWGLLLIVIILGGIYAGVFTPTEAAAVSIVYAFFIAVFVNGDITIKDVPRVVMVVNMQIGLVTPPVGLNLFVTAGVAGMSLEGTIKASAPWLAVLLVVLLLSRSCPGYHW